MSQIENVIITSVKLARVQLNVYPDLQLAWIPDDEEGLCDAAQTLIEHTNNSFPVLDMFCWESWHVVHDWLDEIPICLFGYEHEDSSHTEWNKSTGWRLMLILVELFHLWHDGDGEFIASCLNELEDDWGIFYPAPLDAIVEEIENAFEEPKDSDFLAIAAEERWLQLIAASQYLTQSTGIPWLDVSEMMQGYAGGHGYRWTQDHIEELTSMWATAQPVWDVIGNFMSWVKEQEGRDTVAKMIELAGQRSSFETPEEWENWRDVYPHAGEEEE